MTASGVMREGGAGRIGARKWPWEAVGGKGEPSDVPAPNPSLPASAVDSLRQLSASAICERTGRSAASQEPRGMVLAQYYLLKKCLRALLLATPGFCLPMLLAHAGPLYDAYSRELVGFWELLYMMGLWL